MKVCLNISLIGNKYLKTDKLFGNSDPIFPRNMLENAEGTKTFISNSVEPKFWQSVTSMREILKARFQILPE